MKLYICLILCTLVLAYREEKIISAQEVERIGQGSIGKMGFHHYGILVKTNLGNTYLIHTVPDKGIVVTKTPLSSKWKLVKILTVKGDKTIGGALEYNSGVTHIGIINYLTSGTCIGTAKQTKNYLKR